MIINLWHLKNTNGMFYYALDYISLFPGRELKIILRPSLYNLKKEELKGYSILKLTLTQYISYLIKSFMCGDSIFTPTSHPIPFYSNQVIVVHDSFPFRGLIGKIKYALIRLSLASSKCRVGYINNTDSYEFVASICKQENRYLFLPNLYPTGCLNLKLEPTDGDSIIIGLVGTDSQKKNYEQLFSEVTRKQLTGKVRFLIYGHDTQYFQELMSSYSNLNIRLVKSDSVDLCGFLGKIQILVSVAKNEGFGRPIACAVLSDIPCYLIEDEVFREFYSNSAYFSPSVSDLLDVIISNSLNGWGDSENPAKTPQWLLDAVFLGVSKIREGSG
jgi:hypothetical protein